MTIKSIKDPDFMYWQVRNLDTGQLIDCVKYANDETGTYIRSERWERSAIDRVYYGANIRLEDVREKYSPPPEKDGLLEALEGAKKIVKFFEMLVEERTAWRAGG